MRALLERGSPGADVFYRSLLGRSQIGIPNGRRQIASWPKAQFYPRESEDFLKRSQDPVCAPFAQRRLESTRHPGLARLINGMCLAVQTDAERLERGAIVFDSLYNGLAEAAKPRRRWLLFNQLGALRSHRS